MALLRSVSHDLRTPLATIRAVATDLRDSNLHDDETRQELLKSVSDEAERLDRLVGNLLSMSRIEAGSLNIEYQVVDLTELLQLAILRLGPLFSRVEVEVQIDPALPLIDGDPVLLDEVISNLLENAARYAPASSTVSVISPLPRAHGHAAGRDHGPGVESGLCRPHLPSVLAWPRQPFERTRPGDREGHRRGARGHDPRLAETSGGGATFEVRLPAREDAML